MKRRKLLSLLLTVAMAISLIPATVMADDDEKESIEIETVYVEGETVTLEDVADDSDEMFAGFVNLQFGIADAEDPVAKRGAKSRGAARAGDALEGVSHYIYEGIAAEIGKIATGERTSTRFDVPLPSYHFTAAEFGQSILNQTAYDEAMQKIMDEVGDGLTMVLQALIKDFPYDLFWCSKDAQYGGSFPYECNDDRTEFDITPTIQIYLKIYPEYQSSEQFVLSDVILTVNDAAELAQSVVAMYAEYSDRDKLLAYKDWICENTSYNDDAAAAQGSAGYGNSNPWQLIWVFDGDPETNVVCEGYAKAFKYLCDLSTFSDPNIDCYIVTGAMDGGTGAGPHMWNMVTLEDGNHYLVDVTNCDGDPNSSEVSIGYPDKLFLRIYDEKETVEKTESGTSYSTTLYTYHINSSDSIQYWYDLDTVQLYPADLLEVYDGVSVSNRLDVTFRHSCTFNYNLSINYYVEVDSLSGYSDIKLVLNKYGETVEIPARRKTISGTKYYWFQYSGIAAHQMGTDVKAVLHATKDGVEYASAQDIYSVKTYAYNMLDKSSTDTKFRTLLVDMLNYGSAAQKYRLASTPDSALVNAALTSEQQAMGTQGIPSLPNEELSYYMKETDTVIFENVSLTLQSDFAITYLVTIKAGQSTDNLRVECTYTSCYGDQITTSIPFSEFVKDGDVYKVVLNSIAPVDARCNIEANAYDGDTKVGGTFTFSVASYARALLQIESSEKYTNLMYAMMKYCDSARAYFIG